jgi:hypothetical protein
MISVWGLTCVACAFSSFNSTMTSNSSTYWHWAWLWTTPVNGSMSSKMFWQVSTLVVADSCLRCCGHMRAHVTVTICKILPGKLRNPGVPRGSRGVNSGRNRTSTVVGQLEPRLPCILQTFQRHWMHKIDQDIMYVVTQDAPSCLVVLTL